MRQFRYGIVTALLCMALACSAEAALSGSLSAWGFNLYGEANVPGGNDYTAISAGDWHGMALRRDGTLALWGRGSGGQLGMPAGTYKYIAAGGFHSAAIRTDGSIAFAGSTYPTGPATPPGGNDWAALAGGKYHTLALREDGTLGAWGASNWGQAAVQAGTDFLAIAAGEGHSLALRSNGRIVAWGTNADGQCNVPDRDDFVAVGAGTKFSMGITTNGEIVTWGSNYQNESSNPPAGTNFMFVDGGSSFGIAQRLDRTLIGWGSNGAGQANAPSGDNFIQAQVGSAFGLALTFDVGSLMTGAGSLASDIDGFDEGGYATTGMAAGAQALPLLVELSDLVLDGEFATLRVDYDSELLAARGIEADSLRLYWWDASAGEWRLAGNASNLTDNSGDPSYTGFGLGPATDVLGDWGVNMDEDHVWANIDHASTYALAGIPEPATLSLLALGGLAVIRRRST